MKMCLRGEVKDIEYKKNENKKRKNTTLPLSAMLVKNI